MSGSDWPRLPGMSNFVRNPRAEYFIPTLFLPELSDSPVWYKSAVEPMTTQSTIRTALSILLTIFLCLSTYTTVYSGAYPLHSLFQRRPYDSMKPLRARSMRLSIFTDIMLFSLMTTGIRQIDTKILCCVYTITRKHIKIHDISL